MAIIKFNVVANDPVTGKKVKFKLTFLGINEEGSITAIAGILSFHEANDDNAIPVNATIQAKRVVESYEIIYQVADKIIDSVTKLYLPSLVDGNNDPIPNAVPLSTYLSTKVINSYPGVGGGDQAWKFYEGVAKEIIAVRQANGELPS